MYYSNIHEPGSFENCYALGGITEPKKWWSLWERDIRVPQRLNRTKGDCKSNAFFRLGPHGERKAAFMPEHSIDFTDCNLRLSKM